MRHLTELNNASNCSFTSLFRFQSQALILTPTKHYICTNLLLYFTLFILIAHSTFKLLNLAAFETTSYNISKSSNQRQVRKRCHLIVWNECSMAHKGALKILARALKGIRDYQAPMGGITLLLSGDFTQTLPVIPTGTRADKVQACLKSCTLWRHVTILP